MSSVVDYKCTFGCDIKYNVISAGYRITLLSVNCFVFIYKVCIYIYYEAI